LAIGEDFMVIRFIERIILKPFSIFRNALAREPCLHGRGGYKIIYFSMHLGRHMPSQCRNRS